MSGYQVRRPIDAPNYETQTDVVPCLYRSAFAQGKQEKVSPDEVS
jgi:hypothetical protein